MYTCLHSVSPCISTCYIVSPHVYLHLHLHSVSPCIHVYIVSLHVYLHVYIVSLHVHMFTQCLLTLLPGDFPQGPDVCPSCPHCTGRPAGTENMYQTEDREGALCAYCCYIFSSCYLADAGEARGSSTKTNVIHRFIN